MNPQFTAVSRILHTAKRNARVGEDHGINEHLPGFDFTREAGLLATIVRPDACAEPIAGGVRQFDRGINPAYAEHRRDRPE
jgi:hypothetical protein